MGIKRSLLVAVLAVFAFAALPAVASANPKFDFEGSTHFTVEGGKAELITEIDTITCQSVSGTGEFESGQTGTIQFLFHECKDEPGLNCTSKGQSTGTVTTEELPFHLVTATEEGKPAVLITPNKSSEQFANFACFVVSVTVGGNGLIGELTQTVPHSFEIAFGEAEGVQAPTTVIGSATEYDLEATIGEEIGTAVAIATATAAGTGTFVLTGPELDFEGSTHFTVEGGESKLTTGLGTVTCTSVIGTGEFENSQKGSIQFLFHGCGGLLGFNCKSEGQSTGTILTEELSFHLITATEEGKPAILITPNAETEDFANFVCFVVTVTLGGNGIIGEMANPAYEEEGDEFEISFGEAKGVQAPTTVIGSATEYDLKTTIGEEVETVAQVMTLTGTFTNGDNVTLTHGEE